MAETGTPLAVIHSVAPIRICDNGCWTDTWFAGHGRVFNIAVQPGAEVRIAVFKARSDAARVVLHAENFGPPYEVRHAAPPWGPHPLLEAAIASMPTPPDVRLEVRIHSEAPPGAGTGTSAAVIVALIGALDALTPGRLTQGEVAMAAHRVETVMLGRQAGVQDQIASAHGGINFIEITEYPNAVVTPVRPPTAVMDALQQRLALVYLGKSHDSSAIHESVIRSLETAGPNSAAIVELRGAARRSRAALLAGDFEGLGRAMTASTEAQARLHESLVSDDARRVCEIAKRHGVLGWKVNGAGGDGGSLTLLGDGRRSAMDDLVREIDQVSPAFRLIPITLDLEGLRVWRGESE